MLTLENIGYKERVSPTKLELQSSNKRERVLHHYNFTKAFYLVQIHLFHLFKIKMGILSSAGLGDGFLSIGFWTFIFWISLYTTLVQAMGPRKPEVSKVSA